MTSSSKFLGAAISANTWCPCRCTAHPYNSLQPILLPADAPVLYLMLMWSINEAAHSCIFLPSSKPPGQQRDGINNSQYATKKNKATALTYHLSCSTGPAMQLVRARSWKPLWLEWSWKPTFEESEVNLPKTKSHWVSLYLLLWQ